MYIIQTNNSRFFIEKTSILSIEIENRKCQIYTTKGKFITDRKALGKLIEEIDYKFIIRCHKSFAVNVKNMKGMIKVRKNIWKPVFLFNYTEANCEISQTYYNDVIVKYKEIWAS